jgi:mono/diheme cytochrome c family protein
MKHGAWLALPLLLAGCERSRQDMYDQPKYKPLAASTLFADGASARTVPDGALPQARGPFAGSSSGRIGADAVSDDASAQAAPAMPYPIDARLLARGRQRYEIFCLPCHGAVGAGDGRIVQRGFPRPPPFVAARLRGAPDRHLYDVISQGYGVMYPFADKLEPSERWAVVAYLRALQLSQHADAASLPPAMRARLPAAPDGGKP